MTKYILTKDIAYGIAALDEEGNILQTVPAIHTDEKIVSEFVAMCNTEELELVHLNNVIEDFRS